MTKASVRTAISYAIEVNVPKSPVITLE